MTWLFKSQKQSYFMMGLECLLTQSIIHMCIERLSLQGQVSSLKTLDLVANQTLAAVLMNVLEN